MLFNKPRRYKLRDIALSDAIGTLAYYVGKSTQVALKEGAAHKAFGVHEISFDGSKVREQELRARRKCRTIEYHLGYWIELVGNH